MFDKFGVQLYTIRDAMGTVEEVRESFRKLKELGYDYAQTAGCKIPYAEFGALAKEAGIEICGTHDNYQKMVENTELAMEEHRLLGTTNMGIGGHHSKTLEECEAFIKEANALAKKIAPYGFKFTYHNHSAEFLRYENGKTEMDMLAEGLDPEYVSFVLDTYWVQHGGADVRYWIEKLAGRIDILHLKDMARIPDMPGEPRPERVKITEIGNGNLWWEGILETAEKAGVKYYVVEQDICPGDPFDSLRMSAEYLKKLRG